jgi:tRNA(fMet)-specific endonuclease VapC
VTDILLDTDSCIEIIRGNPQPLERWPDGAFFISSITTFEILSGLKQTRRTKREARALEFLETVEQVPFDVTAAGQAAEVRKYLEKRGTPIGAYDLLLAGQALALGVPILTGNEREFSRVAGLQVLSWR